MAPHSCIPNTHACKSCECYFMFTALLCNFGVRFEVPPAYLLLLDVLKAASFFSVGVKQVCFDDEEREGKQYWCFMQDLDLWSVVVHQWNWVSEFLWVCTLIKFNLCYSTHSVLCLLLCAGIPAGVTQTAQHSSTVPAADVCSSATASDAANRSPPAAAQPQHRSASEPGCCTAGQQMVITSKNHFHSVKLILLWLTSCKTCFRKC